jgi:hypothetical protein
MGTDRLPIQSMKDVTPGTRLRMLLYGDPKVGKTTLGVQWPAPLILDFDDGLQGFAGKNVHRMCCESWAEWKSAIRELQLHQALRYETVVVDTLSAAQSLAIQDILRATSHQTMERDDWGLLLREMQFAIDTLFSLPTHVLVLCHAREHESNGLLEVRPDLAGQTAGYVQRACDSIGHLRSYVDRQMGDDGRFSVKSTVRIVSFMADHRVAGNRCRLIDQWMHKQGKDELTTEELAKIAKELPRRDLQPAKAGNGSMAPPEETEEGASDAI